MARARLSSETSRKQRKPKATRIIVLLRQFNFGIYNLGEQRLYRMDPTKTYRHIEPQLRCKQREGIRDVTPAGWTSFEKNDCKDIAKRFGRSRFSSRLSRSH
jgi:hypothetical protein